MSTNPDTADMLRDAAWHGSMGLAVIDDSGRLALANPAFCALFDIDPALCKRLLPLADLIERFVAETPPDLRFHLTAQHPLTITFDAPGRAAVRLHAGSWESGQRLLIAEILTGQGHITGHTCMQSRTKIPTSPTSGRAYLERLLTDCTAQSGETPTSALVLVDLDGFKHVNEAVGHVAGDQVLQLAAKRMASAVRDDDAVVPLGGDEFAIVVTNSEQPAGAEAVVRRIIELVARPFLVDGQQVNLTACAGIAILDRDSTTPADLLTHATLALHQAKHNGKGQYHYFEPTLAAQTRHRREIELHLRRALALKELHLQYQPQIDLQTGAITGFEALMRWHNPVHGMISPADFIPMAEELGEIIAMGDWALRAACREAMAWPTHFRVAVNASPLQFQSDAIVDSVRDALASSGLPPHRLELEITEGVLLHNTEPAIKRLWALQELGVGIAMDDFGTGYSSLSYLNSFPFSKIKIDQAFVRQIDTRKSLALIHAIISLGDSLDITTIAEGVESGEQLAVLRASGCRQAQGYLISRPIAADAIPAFVSAYRAPENTGGRHDSQ